MKINKKLCCCWFGRDKKKTNQEFLFLAFDKKTQPNLTLTFHRTNSDESISIH